MIIFAKKVGKGNIDKFTRKLNNRFAYKYKIACKYYAVEQFLFVESVYATFTTKEKKEIAKIWKEVERKGDKK